MSKGYNQSDIAKELHTTRRTVLRDVAELTSGRRRRILQYANTFW